MTYAPRRPRRALLLLILLILLVLLAACSSASSSSNKTAKPSTTTTGAPRPATGPAATISGPITGGKGTPTLVGATVDNLDATGYSESEFFADGTAQSYAAVGASGRDGHWTAKPKDTAKYRTRIVVRRPSDVAKFNGTVVVEWLNVSSGADTAPDWGFMNPELMRSGYTWVGVSVQLTGVSGGTPLVPVTGISDKGIKGDDPARYTSLHHPGDAYAFDLFSQIGRALRAPGATDPLGGEKPQRLLAVGESQSAFELTTYLNAVEPITHVYDGYFVHSRGGGAIPLVGGNIARGIDGSVHIRDDLSAPVLVFETETDEMTLRYFDARQPDTDHLRLWDVAGGAHADSYVVGGNAALLGCKGEINAAPTHYAVEAGLHTLDQWVQNGSAPAPVPRMEVKLEGGAPIVQRDALGNALGGLRLPALDVPVVAYTGVAADSSKILCTLFGGTHPFDAPTLARLYPNKAAYVDRFTKAADDAIAAGHVLPTDRAAMLAEAANVKISGT